MRRPGVAISTRMKATPIRVRAPRERQVRRVVARQDRARVVLEQRDRGGRRALAVVVRERDVGEPARRVRGRAAVHAMTILKSVQVSSALESRRSCSRRAGCSRRPRRVGGIVAIGLAMHAPLHGDEASYAVLARGDATGWVYRSRGVVALAHVGLWLGGGDLAMRLASAVLGARRRARRGGGRSRRGRPARGRVVGGGHRGRASVRAARRGAARRSAGDRGAARRDRARARRAVARRRAALPPRRGRAAARRRAVPEVRQRARDRRDRGGDDRRVVARDRAAPGPGARGRRGVRRARRAVRRDVDPRPARRSACSTRAPR